MKTILQNAKKKFFNFASNEGDITEEEECNQSLLIDEENHVMLQKDPQDKNKKFLFGIGVLTSILILSKLSLIFFNLSFRYYYKKFYITDINYNNFVIPNYFQLKEISPTSFKIHTAFFGILCCTEVMILFSHLLQRSMVPELKKYRLEIIFAMISGLLISCIEPVRGWVRIEDIIESNFTCWECKETLNTPEVYFIGVHIIIILYGLFIGSLLRVMEKKYQSENKEHYELTMDFKLITLGLLFLMLLIYFLIYGHSIHVFTFTGWLEKMVIQNSLFVKTFFPYFIHVLVAIYLLCFYLDLKYIRLSLTQNLNADYVF